MRLEPADLQIIQGQLGRPPRGVLEVGARCSSGHPAVAVCSPVLRTARGVVPFPTIYWLTCPVLRKAVSEVERTGGITAARRWLAEDAPRLAAVEADHRRYAAARWALLSEEEKELVRGKGWEKMFREGGVAGARHFWAVKCLHAHLAQHLVEGNTLGRWLVERYPAVICAVG